MFPNGGRAARNHTESRFNSFLDALAGHASWPDTSRHSDHAMAETARRFQARGDADKESAPHPGTLDMIWEDLMQQQGAVPSSATTHAPSTQARIAKLKSRGRRSSPRPRSRVARFPYGEVAIAAVIVLLLSTAFAVYRESRPTRPGEPSRLPAAASVATPALVPIVADPALCAIEPRTLEALEQLMPTPGASATKQNSMASVPRRTSEPVGDETVASVTDTMRDLYACVSDNNHLRAYALFTDDALRHWFAQHGLLTPEELVDGPGTREAFRILAVYYLEDDRIGATIEFQVSEGKFHETWIFARVSDRYLVDGIVRPDPMATPAVATRSTPIATPAE